MIKIKIELLKEYKNHKVKSVAKFESNKTTIKEVRGLLDLWETEFEKTVGGANNQ